MSWVNKLLLWFKHEQRQMPWRQTKTNKVEPWQIWVSEVMLQQTTVATVTPKYLDFMERWPRFEALSLAKEEDILHFWQGLGYYSRARNLYKAIREITKNHQGILPHKVEELKKLPGFGDYTAAAVAAIAFNEKAAAIDGNVARVLARFWLMEDKGEQLKAKQRQKLIAYIPEAAGDFAQSLIELGALICRPKNPKCHHCPLQDECKAYEYGLVDIYPKKQAKKASEKRQAQFYIIKNPKNEILFLKRPAKGLLASMDVLPSDDWYKDDFAFDISRLKNSAKRKKFLYEFTHIFTHIHLTAKVYTISIEKTEQKLWNEGFWVKKAHIQNLALPTIIKKAIHDVSFD